MGGEGAQPAGGALEELQVAEESELRDQLVEMAPLALLICTAEGPLVCREPLGLVAGSGETEGVEEWAGLAWLHRLTTAGELTQWERWPCCWWASLSHLHLTG